MHTSLHRKQNEFVDIVIWYLRADCANMILFGAGVLQHTRRDGKALA
jgi:hypothetical protein